MGNPESNKNRETRNIFLILLLALVLRLLSINQSLWLDEAINVLASRNLSLSTLVNHYILGDFHPPLYHILLWFWFKIVPATEFYSRLPSLIFGVLSVWLTYLIAKKLFREPDNYFAFISALLLATSGLHVYYSQEARMYSLATFLTCLVVYSLLRLKDRTTNLKKFIFVISLSLLLISDYQPWLLIPLLLYFCPGLTSLSLLLTIFWWPTIIRQVTNGLKVADSFPVWKAVVGGISFKSTLLVPVKFLIGRISFINKYLYLSALLPSLVVTFIAFRKLLTKQSSKLKLLVGWLFVPFLIGIPVAARIPLFTYFRFLFVLPAFYILLVFGISKLPGKQKKLALTVMILTNLFTTGYYLTNERFHRENWKGLSQYLDQYSRDNTLVVIPNLAQASGFYYYNAAGYRIEDNSTLNLDNELTDVLLIRYVSEIFDPEEMIASRLKIDGFEKIEEIHFTGILVWHYKRV